MKDKLGIFLLEKRIKEVIPFIEGKLLDIGCGTNELVRSYSGEGIGVDVYPWENADLIVEDTSKLPFDDKSFDTVTIIAALNHIPNREEVLIEIHRILKDDGKFIFTNVGATISQIWHFLRRRSDVDQTERGMKEGEVWGFSKLELEDLFLKSKFQVIKKGSFNLGINKIFILKK
tara:strand:- start:15 stop:539 length:525 start_codon:yes stop_codon:yes gene_type:complete